jgi:MFS family permease
LQSKLDKERKRAYQGLFFVNFLVTLGFGIVDPFFPVYVVSCGAAGLHLALIFSGYATAKTIMSPFAGSLSDRFGRRALILSGLSLYGVISLCYLFFADPLALVVLRFLQGIAAATVRPVSLAFVGDMAPQYKEGSTMSTFDISFYGALAVGPLIGGVIKDIVGFPGLFLSLAFFCLLSLVAALVFVTPTFNGGRNGADECLSGLSVLKRSRVLVGLSGFIFARSFGITLFAIFVPVFMHKNLRLAGIDMGIIMGTATISMLLLLKPMGMLSDRINRGHLVLMGGAMAALLTFCLPLAETFLQLLLLAAGIGFFSAISLPASSALLVQEGNLYGMGVVMGTFNGAMNLAAVLAPLVGGLALGFFGINALFYGGGIVGFLGTIFFFATIAVHGKERHDYQSNLRMCRGRCQ